MNTNKYTKGEALSFGWSKMKANFFLFLSIMIVYFVVVMAFGFINTLLVRNEMTSLASIVSLVSTVVQIIMSMGLITAYLKIYDGKETGVADLFTSTKNLVNYFVGSLLYVVIVILGYILLIIPGIYWTLKYMFLPYLIIDKGMKPMEALKKSGEMTDGYKFDLLLFWILMMLINMVGMLLLGLGLLVTIPMTMMAMVYVYRKLLGENAPAAQPAAPMAS